MDIVFIREREKGRVSLDLIKLKNCQLQKRNWVFVPTNRNFLLKC